MLKLNKHSFNLLTDWGNLVSNKNAKLIASNLNCSVDIIKKFKLFIETFYDADYSEKEFVDLFKQNVDDNVEHIHAFRYMIIKEIKGMSIKSLVQSFHLKYLLKCCEDAINALK